MMGYGWECRKTLRKTVKSLYCPPQYYFHGDTQTRPTGPSRNSQSYVGTVM